MTSKNSRANVIEDRTRVSFAHKFFVADLGDSVNSLQNQSVLSQTIDYSPIPGTSASKYGRVIGGQPTSGSVVAHMPSTKQRLHTQMPQKKQRAQGTRQTNKHVSARGSQIGQAGNNIISPMPSRGYDG